MGWIPHSDANAIHDNVAGEINALTTVTPVSGDWVLIEDASDSNNKKKVNASDFLGGGGGAATLDHDIATATHTFTNSARTLISWDSAVKNALGGFDLGTDATIWTAPSTGVFVVEFQILNHTAAFSGRRLLNIAKNGVVGAGTTLVASEAQFSTNTTSGSNAIWAGSLTSGDDLYFEVFQDSGSDRTGDAVVIIHEAT